jgi:lysophospholipase L1-like esterase
MKGILCLGDSITHGRGEMPSTGWVGRLKNYYESQEFYHCVFNLGIPGNTSKEMLNRIDVEAKARAIYHRPDSEYIMTISVGTNDIGGKGSPEAVIINPKKFRKNILSLIKKARKYVQKVVFIGTIPVDESKNPIGDLYFTNKKQEDYNQIVRECCEKENVLFLDLYSKWIEMDYLNLLYDDVHPNSNGYELMYEQIKEFLIKEGLMK